MGEIERTILDEGWAREAYGEATNAFMKEVAAAAAKHGILAVTVTTVAADGIRTISTGSDDKARGIAARLALHFQDQVQLIFGQAGRG